MKKDKIRKIWEEKKDDPKDATGTGGSFFGSKEYIEAMKKRKKALESIK